MDVFYCRWIPVFVILIPVMVVSVSVDHQHQDFTVI